MSKKPGRLKRFRYFLEWALLAGAFWLIPKCPRWILLKLAKFLGTLGFYFDGRGRRTAFTNLGAAFPGRWTDTEREDVVHRCYQSWARTYLDQFWTRNVNQDNFHEFLTYEIVDPEGWNEVVERGAPCQTPHYGNFEWGSAGLAFMGVRYTAIAQDFKNERLTKIFQTNRELWGHTMIPQEKAFLKFMRALKRGQHVGFLPDLTVPPDQAATMIRFFGLKVSVTLLGPVLIKRLRMPMMAAITLPCEDGTYVYRILEPLIFDEDATEQEIAQASWDVFEPIIAERPEHWLWMYKFFRFRPADDEGRSYPDYANRSKKFDKLEREVSAKAASK
ncbi:MAG: KDO2-lipid IV(A) lauroyltransferase [Verrucomicrobiales bacterium]|jgi:KDO2-lipid IV(A) lauroyltransferase